MSIFDASVKYAERGVPLVILAGKEYGSGSSRDWAAKGPMLLGVARRHRRELRAHPPLEPGRHGRSAAAVRDGQTVECLGLTGEEVFDFPGLKPLLDAKFANGRTLKVSAKSPDGKTKEFEVTVRIDTPQEILYYENGGILQYVLRSFAAKELAALNSQQ